MRVLTVLLVSLLVGAVVGLLPLKHASLGEEYSIGKIWDLHFMPDGRLFFRSEEDLFGFLDDKNGRLLSVYELEGSEQVVDFVLHFEVVIANGKSLNMFLPNGERYFRLMESKFIQDYNYSQIIGFKRHINGSYILTDSQLISLPMRLDPRKAAEGKELLLREANERFISLNSRIYKSSLDYVVVSRQTDSRKLCLRSIRNNLEKKCLELPENRVLVDVVMSMSTIFLEFEDGVWVYDEELKKVSELEDTPKQYHNGLVVLGGEGGEHTYFDPVAGTLYSSRIIAEDPSISPQLTMKVQPKSLLIERKGKDVVTIAKEEGEEPRKVWAQWNTSDPNQHKLYVEFEDDSLVCYLISEKKHTSAQLWKIATKVAEREANGTITEGEEGEADIAEEEKQNINVNGGVEKEVVPNNPEEGKEQAMKEALLREEEERRKMEKPKEPEPKGDGEISSKEVQGKQVENKEEEKKVESELEETKQGQKEQEEKSADVGESPP